MKEKGRPAVHPLVRLIPKVWIDNTGPFGIRSPCWRWRGTCSASGYAQLRLPNTTVRAHRWLYEHVHGSLGNQQLDHLCEVRDCVNPKHLEPVTCKENLRRSPRTQASINGDKTHCIHGHSEWGRTSGKRYCRVCQRKRTQRWRKAQKEEVKG